MTLLALELNDAGVLAVGEAGQVSLPSPGFAFVDQSSLLVGRAAAARTRMTPRRIHSRFWQELDIEPLRRPFSAHLRTADLAHAHLSSIWAEAPDGVDRVLLAVPGRYSDHQLGLMLGIANACQMPVTGFVDAAVAAVSEPDLPEVTMHLDLQLHEAVVTVLEHSDQIARRAVELADVGMLDLSDAWAKSIAGQFLRTTRFDPLHLAETEQKLYDLLPVWLQQLRSADSVTATLQAAGRRYDLELDRQSLAVAAQHHYQRLAELLSYLGAGDRRTVLALSHRASRLPGFEQLIDQQIGVRVTALPIAAAAVGALRHAEDIETSGDLPRYVTRLPRATSSGTARMDAGVPPDQHQDRRPPTHVVLDGVALTIGDDPLLFGLAPGSTPRAVTVTGTTAGISRCHCSIVRRGDTVIVKDLSRYGTFVNNKLVDVETELVVGDRVRLGTPGVVLELIAVES